MEEKHKNFKLKWKIQFSFLKAYRTSGCRDLKGLSRDVEDFNTTINQLYTNDIFKAFNQ